MSVKQSNDFLTLECIEIYLKALSQIARTKHYSRNVKILVSQYRTYDDEN